MAPRTPKDPGKDSAAKPAKPVKAEAPAAKAKPAASKPALKVVEAAAAAEPKAALKLKDLIDSVAAATGAKKPDVKKTVEATLHALGEALATGKSLSVPPLGKLRVVKNKGPALTLKLRLADGAKAAGLALADDGEDS
ncbi:MAG: HU family DNA-binding protein [Paracoccaceae bacterium]